MKKMKLFYFLFAVLMLFVFAAPASAVDLDATTCSGTNWSWSSSNNTCLVLGYVYISDITIPTGTTLYINNLGYFYTNATITNFGTINNVGTINIVGTIINKCGGTFANSGTFIGNPVLYESCTPPIVIDLNESTCIGIIGGDWNSNTCYVNGSYNISSVMTLNINSGIFLKIIGILGNFGTININDSGNFSNFNVIYNGGNGTINVNDGGNFSNSNVIYNDATINIACGGIFSNTGIIDGNPVNIVCESSTGGGPVIFTPNVGSIESVISIAPSTLPLPPTGTTLPYGVFSFNIIGITPAGSSVTLTLTFPNLLPAGTTYWKYQESHTPSWYSITPDAISGNQMTITLTDGGPGDEDGMENGIISDPGGPGTNYHFIGFFPPVDNLVLNSAKAGQAIPLKWRLLDAYSIPVTDLASVDVTATTLKCPLGVTTDQIEEYATGSSGLQNLGNGYYQFDWKTPKAYANSCKTLILNTSNSEMARANFQFLK